MRAPARRAAGGGRSPAAASMCRRAVAGDSRVTRGSRVTRDKNLGTIARITSRLGFQIRDKNNKNLGTITRITSRLGFQIRDKNNKNLETITRITSRLGFQIRDKNNKNLGTITRITSTLSRLGFQISLNLT